ncbi:hypothetical protein [Veronia pacifica]|uniref:Uncharacterized protein n=1 Tax=Veronia pacifica TaxID=1080227 RepID=A0A1C3E9C0_9GAMM|nr:hypothetical protein [Veronia pacifica]ODA29868.1 hypothetical protein A8L45_21450 [Veronia pacifica]
MSATITPQSEFNQTKLFISLTSGVILAVLLWVGSTVNSTQIAVAKLQTELISLRADLAESSERNKVFQQDLRSLEQRVRDLETKR